MTDLLWPAYGEPADLARIEAVPLAERGLPQTTYAVLCRAARLWPDGRALSVLPTSAHWRHPVVRTFAELLADVHRSANALHHVGIRRGDGVALLAPNCDELITATLAAQLVGIAAPMNSALTPEHLTDLVVRSGSRVLVAAGPDLAPQVWERARALAADAGLVALFALSPTGADPTPLEPLEGIPVAYLSATAAAQPSDRFLGPEPEAGDIAALFHTGGTTGIPKLAAHTHRNEVTDAWMIALTSLLSEGSVVLAGLPLFHVNAVHVTLLAPLLRGLHGVWAGPLGYRDPALFANFWRIVEHYRVSTMSAVPTVYSVLAGVPVDADISSMRFAVVGASPLPQAVRRGFEEATGIRLVEGYGLTEATCASVISFPGAPRAESVGQRLPYQVMKAVDIMQEGEWVDLPTGVAGVLAIAGPTVFAGYAVGTAPHGPVLDTGGTVRDGWLNTGDLARVDADGFVYLTGRAKDLIIRGGHNIDPAVIEAALLAHPDVTDAQAVGRPDPHAGEVPVAFVTIGAGREVTEDELRTWAAAHVPEAAAAPKAVTVLPTLPVTSVGKPYKPALRAQATQAAVRDALSDMPGVTDVRSDVERGAVVTVLTLTAGADRGPITDVLDRLPITWREEPS